LSGGDLSEPALLGSASSVPGLVFRFKVSVGDWLPVS
jgi:hypothetical protein